MGRWCWPWVGRGRRSWRLVGPFKTKKIKMEKVKYKVYIRPKFRCVREKREQMSAGKRARANAVEDLKTYRSKAEEARAALRVAGHANARLHVQAGVEADEIKRLEGRLEALDYETVRTYRGKAEAARAALRGAARAQARLQAVAEEDEIKTLEGQLDALDYESDLDHTDEFVIIKNRCRRLEEQCNRAASEEGNKALSFSCSVCFDNCEMAALRIITPCGHGFCFECTDGLEAAAGKRKPEEADPGCPTCRGVVGAVLKTYF